MFCKIADLYTEVPAADGLDVRCKNYVCEDQTELKKVDIVIRQELYATDQYPKDADKCAIAYMESGAQFLREVLQYDGLYLHASAVELDGKAYLFSAPCGTGKSTHTRLWQKAFGERAQVFNDDKPVLRRLDGKWYAYGTPWCGKDGINQNKKVPLAGICFLEQSKENKIHRLQGNDIFQRIFKQTIYRISNPVKMNKMLTQMDLLIREIPIYLLENRPEVEAAMLSYETMSRGAKEAGL